MTTRELPSKVQTRKHAAAVVRGEAQHWLLGRSPAAPNKEVASAHGSDPSDAQQRRYLPAASPLLAQAIEPPSKSEAIPPPEAASLLFDPDWYRRRYPDVAVLSHDPVFHYEQHGAAEGRKPNPFFDTAWYLKTYPDVRGAALNPFVHYLLYGYREGRLPRASGSEPESVD